MLSKDFKVVILHVNRQNIVCHEKLFIFRSFVVSLAVRPYNWGAAGYDVINSPGCLCSPQYAPHLAPENLLRR